jgi:NAD(P)-dependent dehydrogenase (short-subunit alcohol dehydrogenase family)
MAQTNVFDLTDRVVVVTGGAGLLGRRHAEAIAGAGGTPVLIDIDAAGVDAVAAETAKCFAVPAFGLGCDITDLAAVETARDAIIDRLGRIDGLLNNAANNPKVENSVTLEFSRLESFSLDAWNADLAVGLTGAFLCARVFGGEMARRGGGAIVNIASDLSVIAPDQRLYRDPDRSANHQPVKPVTYSVVKAGVLGLTRYLATYWTDEGVRCNALSPGGIYDGQPDEFVKRLANLIPMGRMANPDEYNGAIVFLLSNASRYMTGQNLVIDGGRTVW